jgi:hypothetical protein
MLDLHSRTGAVAGRSVIRASEERRGVMEVQVFACAAARTQLDAPLLHTPCYSAATRPWHRFVDGSRDAARAFAESLPRHLIRWPHRQRMDAAAIMRTLSRGANITKRNVLITSMFTLHKITIIGDSVLRDVAGVQLVSARSSRSA